MSHEHLVGTRTATMPLTDDTTYECDATRHVEIGPRADYVILFIDESAIAGVWFRCRECKELGEFIAMTGGFNGPA